MLNFIFIENFLLKTHKICKKSYLFYRSLLTHDSVSFYALVNSQQKTDCAMKGSGWHFLPSAEIIFTTAKERVYTKNSEGQIHLDAEPHPKWLVLSEILTEIHKEFNKQMKSISKSNDPPTDQDVEKKLADMFGTEKDSSADPERCDNEIAADILILTRDERNCSQLQMVWISFFFANNFINIKDKILINEFLVSNSRW